MDVKKVRVNGEMLKQFAGTQSFVMLIGERTGVSTCPIPPNCLALKCGLPRGPLDWNPTTLF